MHYCCYLITPEPLNRSEIYEIMEIYSEDYRTVPYYETIQELKAIDDPIREVYAAKTDGPPENWELAIFYYNPQSLFDWFEIGHCETIITLINDEQNKIFREQAAKRYHIGKEIREMYELDNIDLRDTDMPYRIVVFDDDMKSNVFSIDNYTEDQLRDILKELQGRGYILTILNMHE